MHCLCDNIRKLAWKLTNINIINKMQTRNNELEKKLSQDIGNTDLWLEYAEWLESKDVPRGELIRYEVELNNNLNESVFNGTIFDANPEFEKRTDFLKKKTENDLLKLSQRSDNAFLEFDPQQND